jgi:hypothetical protein
MFWQISHIGGHHDLLLNLVADRFHPLFRPVDAALHRVNRHALYSLHRRVLGSASGYLTNKSIWVRLIVTVRWIARTFGHDLFGACATRTSIWLLPAVSSSANRSA